MTLIPITSTKIHLIVEKSASKTEVQECLELRGYTSIWHWTGTLAHDKEPMTLEVRVYEI